MHDTEEDCEESFDKEIKTGSAGLNHINVLKIMGAGRDMFTHEGQEQGDRFYVVTELAPNGELFDLVSEAEGLNGSKLKYCRTIFSQIAEGVNHLHDKGIAHRDLKLENCFLDKACNVKVADFGLMKIFGGPTGEALKTKLGTLNYMAPEIHAGNTYTESVDIFAMGVMLFMMLTC